MNTRDPRDEIMDEAVDGEIIEPMSMGALATLQKVEIDQQVATAKTYPRNVPKIKQELTALVTMDEDTADDCIYALPRGQKHIKGPSARFADALISYWGNARSGAFITQVNRDEKFVEAIGSFQDVERNVIRQRRVRRPIADRSGRIYNADMINMTGNAACVIAERNAILNGIPKSLWSGAYEQAFALVAGTTKTLGEKLERATKAFALQGITMEQVLEKIGAADISKVVPDDIVTMRGMLTALKTGEETVETIFGRGAGAPGHEVVKNPLKDDPISSGPTRGNEHDVNMANTVIDPEGRIIKARDGVPAGPIVDQRLAPGKQKFSTIEAWAGATQHLAEPTFPGAASNEAAKSDVAAETVSSNGTNTELDAPATEQTAQAGPAGPAKADSEPEKPYTDAAGYMGFIRDTFDAAKTKSTVTEVWSSTRTDRQQLLDPDQIDVLIAEKEARLQALKKGA